MIIWGRRESRKRKGYAAGYCVCCRIPVVHAVREVREVTHLYYVPIHYKRLVYEAICRECSMIRLFSLDSYDRFVKRPDFEEAISHRTTPDIEDAILESEQYQDTLAQSPIASPMRIDDLVMVFKSLEYMSEYIARRSSSQSITALVQLGLIVSCVGAVFALTGNAGGAFSWIWYISAIVMAIACIYRMTISANKSRVASIEPLLVRAFAPLEPTVDEIRYACDRCHNVAYIKQINPQELIDAIDLYCYSDLITPSSTRPH